jgi:hypothetical protein
VRVVGDDDSAVAEADLDRACDRPLVELGQRVLFPRLSLPAVHDGTNAAELATAVRAPLSNTTAQRSRVSRRNTLTIETREQITCPTKPKMARVQRADPPPRVGETESVSWAMAADDVRDVHGPRREGGCDTALAQQLSDGSDGSIHSERSICPSVPTMLV